MTKTHKWTPYVLLMSFVMTVLKPMTCFAMGSSGDAIEDILLGDRYQGVLNSIAGLVKHLDSISVIIISLVSYGVITFAMLRIIFAACYVAFPRFFDDVHEAHMAKLFEGIDLTNPAGAANNFKTLGSIKKVLLSIVPDVKGWTDFEGDNLDKRVFFMKAIPEAMLLVIIGIFCYNGYGRDVAVKVGQFGSEVFIRTMDNIDPIALVDRASSALSTPDFSSDDATTVPDKLANKISKNMYSMLITQYHDITNIGAKQGIATAIETWVYNTVIANTQSYTQDTEGNKYSSKVNVKYAAAIGSDSQQVSEDGKQALFKWYVPVSTFPFDSALPSDGKDYIIVTVQFNKVTSDGSDASSGSGGTTNASNPYTLSDEVKILTCTVPADSNSKNGITVNIPVEGNFKVTGTTTSLAYLDTKYRTSAAGGYSTYTAVIVPKGTLAPKSLVLPNAIRWVDSNTNIGYKVQIDISVN